MIRKNWGDDGALTLIRVVLERTEDQELSEDDEVDRAEVEVWQHMELTVTNRVRA